MTNQNSEVQILSNLLRDINGALGDESPDNWTRDGILNKITELKKAKKKEQIMQQNIQTYIDATPIYPFVINEREYEIRYIGNANIYVKPNKNIYQAELMINDICHVKAHTVDGELFVQRLSDNHNAVISKEDVSFPKWGVYPF